MTTRFKALVSVGIKPVLAFTAGVLVNLPRWAIGSLTMCVCKLLDKFMITQSTTIKSQISLPKTVLAQFGFSNHCSQAVFDTWELKKPSKQRVLMKINKVLQWC